MHAPRGTAPWFGRRNMVVRRIQSLSICASTVTFVAPTSAARLDPGVAADAALQGDASASLEEGTPFGQRRRNRCLLLTQNIYSSHRSCQGRWTYVTV